MVCSRSWTIVCHVVLPFEFIISDTVRWLVAYICNVYNYYYVFILGKKLKSFCLGNHICKRGHCFPFLMIKLKQAAFFITPNFPGRKDSTASLFRRYDLNVNIILSYTRGFISYCFFEIEMSESLYHLFHLAKSTSLQLVDNITSAPLATFDYFQALTP